VSRSGGVVLITGCSTGIGRATALHLAGQGFTVLAGVRKAEQGEALAAQATASEGRLLPLIVDVADADSISSAAAGADEVAGEGGLTALVNNAGVAVSGPLEFVPLEDFRRQLEVNLVGQLAVTRAMLPALRRRDGGGRVVNITSIGGLVATPFYGPYCASKHALEALSDCLRVELRPWGIKTVAIEPGSIATEIWTSGQDIFMEMLERMDPAVLELYGEALVSLQRISAETGARGIPAQKVAETIERAIVARRPRARYLVGRDARGMATAKRLLPPRLFDRIVARTLKLP
jgi:NAD(P)-dependent dehydrogenase (short-subunit alcohol dehydrogenase family)